MNPDDKRDVARLTPHLRTLALACNMSSESPYWLGALMLRESGAGFAPGYLPAGDPCGWGDKGNAFGLFQIDKRFHARFLATPESQSVAGQAAYACKLLGLNRRLCRVYAHSPELLEVATYCAYNANIIRVIGALKFGKDPNNVTTGHDYGRWIQERAVSLAAAAPSLFAAPTV